MTAIRNFTKVKDCMINIKLPKEFEDQEVEVIIMPKEEEYEFWSDEELDNIGKITYGLMSDDFNDDNEDYSKW